MPSPVLMLFVCVALSFGFLNGFNDSATIVATVISSRAMSPRRALALNALAHLTGPFLFGVAVATTIGHQVLAEQATSLPVAFSGLLAAILWGLLAWRMGVPSSSSHALIGGLVGAAVMGQGADALLLPGLTRVLLTLLLSPLVGLLVGYALMKVVLFLARGATPRINHLFRQAQALTMTALALSHSANDAQKTMGLIAMALLATGVVDRFTIPLWVIAVCAGVMAIGASLGGWRIIRTLGGRFYKIRPVHSFTAQTAAAGVILSAALLGGPVSATHVISTAILGVGSAERVNQVRWGVARQILTAWLLTIPVTALLAALCHMLFRWWSSAR